MKKRIVLVFLLLLFVCFAGCKGKESTDESFLSELSSSKSYKVEGVMETFFDHGRRQSEFSVYYKQPEFIKVILKSVENDDQQIILKNKEGVYVLVPSVNKNFKIQSNWPSNASYPYLLQSLAQDIANDQDPLITETDTTYTIETETKMHTDADAVKQKIIFNKQTNLPTEVLVYDAQGDLFIRCVFTDIALDYNVSDQEFDVEESMTTAYLIYGDQGLTFKNRHFELPSYCSEGLTLSTSENVKTGEDARTIMMFTGENNLTIIQEFINYSDKISTTTELGNVVMVMGNVGIMTDNYIKFIFEGVEYTIASKTLNKNELIKISSSYMMNENK